MGQNTAKTDSELLEFLVFLHGWYQTYARHDLPWRQERYLETYAIAVSECMLQQTQVARVIPYFERWMQSFPDVHSLANAELHNVLVHWNGLGYNNRALRLQKAAQNVISSHGGVFPQDGSSLLTLPGIGEYTAGAIGTFVWNQPNVFIETNIRRVIMYHFYRDMDMVADTQIREIMSQFVMGDILSQCRFDARNFYWAMMDYGSFLKSTLGYNPNRSSKHYTKQSQFEGSFRQKRSAILKYILVNQGISLQSILVAFPDWGEEEIDLVLQVLASDDLVSIKKENIHIKSFGK